MEDWLLRWVLGIQEKKAARESPEQMARRSLSSGLMSAVFTVATALLWTESDPLIEAIGGGSGEAFQIFMFLLLSALGFSLITGAIAVFVGLRALVRHTGTGNAAAGALLGCPRFSS